MQNLSRESSPPRRGKKTVMVDAQACVLCARCLEACPWVALLMMEPAAERTAILHLDQHCTRCGFCVRACPAGACRLGLPGETCQP